MAARVTGTAAGRQLDLGVGKPLARVAKPTRGGTAISAASVGTESVPGVAWLMLIRSVADELAMLALDLDATRADADQVLERLEPTDAAARRTLAVLIAASAGRDPRFSRIPPVEAAEALLRLLHFLEPIRQAAVWVANPVGGPHAVAHIGASRPAQALRGVATSMFAGLAADDESSILGIQLHADGELVGVLTVRISEGEVEEARAAAQVVLDPLTSALMRTNGIDRLPRRQRDAVAAAERRLRRVGLDLHDGPLQSTALLLSETSLLHDQLAESRELSERDTLVVGRLEDLQARVEDLQNELRHIAVSCAEDAVPLLPLDARLTDLVAMFGRRSPIVATLELDGDFSDLTASQQLAVYHIVQEALSNVREHSDASLVRVSAAASGGRVSAQVVDDGGGFDTARLHASRRRGLGVAGMIDRARLLGGTATVDSSIGGPTTVTVELPRWRPRARAPRPPRA